MRFENIIFPVLLAASAVSAFPTVENVAKLMSIKSTASEKRCPFADIQEGVEKAIKKRSLLNPLSSPIEGTLNPCRVRKMPFTSNERLVTGEHSFVPPDFASGDQRGPCPGLNALANHGYIPHNGVVSVSCSVYSIMALVLTKN